MKNPPNPRPPLYYNEDQVRESGLLSPERMEEVLKEVEKRIQPVVLQNGATVPNARLATLYNNELSIFPNASDEWAYNYMRKRVLEGILTDQELQIIDKSCSFARSVRWDEEKFEKATKIAENDWKDGVFWGDNYYDSVADFHDMVGDDEINDFNSGNVGEIAFLWAAKEKKVICDSLNICDDFLESIIEDRGWEDMSVNDLYGIEELKKAFEVFKKKNGNIKAFEIDYSTAILLDSSAQ